MRLQVVQQLLAVAAIANQTGGSVHNGWPSVRERKK